MSRATPSIARFMIHLTRDDGENGGTAEANLQAILSAGQISALNAHCLHRTKLSELPAAIQEQFRTVCFTGSALRSIGRVAKDGARKFKLKPIGLVFHRDFIIENGGQPVAYVNRYYDQTVRSAYDAIFEQALRESFTGSVWKMLPFVSSIHKKRDFEWEREWRIAGHLRFCDTDVVGVIEVPRFLVPGVMRVGVG